MNSKEFQSLLSSCAELNRTFKNEIVFIGGIAVYIHAIHLPNVRDLAETTHDADFYISMTAMSDLRDMEEVTQNLRLSKHQIIKHGFEFDIYTERHARLLVPYADIRSHAKHYDDFQVASLEHLLVLKLEAYKERRSSSKGMKDAKDLLRICLCAEKLGFQKKIFQKYELKHHRTLLEEAIHGPAVVELTLGNSHLAKKYRQIAAQVLK